MMMNTQSKTANIIGSKTARACDSCLHKRARWFCVADDAFLCQTCDSSVHSANPLASRHERVRLETASWKTYKHINKLRDHHESTMSSSTAKTWHQGFTKKPRTPRSRKQQKDDDKDDENKIREQKLPLEALVPEISYDYENEEAEMLLYRVPVRDDITLLKEDEFVDFDLFSNDQDVAGIEIPEFISTVIVGMDLEELDNLLGTEIGEGSCGIQGLCGLSDTFENDCFENTMLKIEEENQELDDVTDCRFDLGLETESESFNWDFDYSKSPIAEEDEDLKISSDFGIIEMKEKEHRKINLKINYEAVMAAWDCQGSPWIDGIKPDFSSDDFWLDFMENGRGIDEINGINGENVGRSGHGGCYDKEREARVLRYREKRRKRLFAKTIRYEVRKLNAEKRPRLKGRFVKRTSLVASSLPVCYMMNNKQ